MASRRSRWTVAIVRPKKLRITIAEAEPTLADAHSGAVRTGRWARVNVGIAADWAPWSHYGLLHRWMGAASRHRAHDRKATGRSAHAPSISATETSRVNLIANFEPDRTLPPAAKGEAEPDKQRLPYGAVPWYIGGDHDDARANSVAIGLHVAEGIGFEDLATCRALGRCELLNVDVTATADAWEMRLHPHRWATPAELRRRPMERCSRSFGKLEETLSVDRGHRHSMVGTCGRVQGCATMGDEVEIQPRRNRPPHEVATGRSYRDRRPSRRPRPTGRERATELQHS